MGESGSRGIDEHECGAFDFRATDIPEHGCSHVFDSTESTG